MIFRILKTDTRNFSYAVRVIRNGLSRIDTIYTVISKVPSMLSVIKQ